MTIRQLLRTSRTACCRSTKKHVQVRIYLVGFTSTLALVTSYLSFLLCDFLRTSTTNPDPENYLNVQSLGIFCINTSSSRSDTDIGGDGSNNSSLYDYDTDSTLWKIAKILGMTSLLLGLLGTLLSYGICMCPNVLLKLLCCTNDQNQKVTRRANLIWHCISAFQCIAAVMEIWALLPYASDVCSASGTGSARYCVPGSGTYLLGISFVLYFVAALVVELTDVPLDLNHVNSLNQKQSSREIIEANRKRMKELKSKHQQVDHKPPQSIGVHHRDRDGLSVLSNVSSITGASGLFQMEAALAETNELIESHQSQSQLQDNDTYQGSSATSASNYVTPWRNFEPMVSSLPPIVRNTTDTTPLDKAPRSSHSIPTTLQSFHNYTNRSNHNQLSFSPIESNDTKVHLVNGSLPSSATRRSQRPTAPHEVKRSTPTNNQYIDVSVSPFLSQTSPFGAPNSSRTMPSSDPVHQQSLSGSGGRGVDTPTGILRKSRFSNDIRASPDNIDSLSSPNSSRWSNSISPPQQHSLRLSNSSPEVSQQARDAMDDPEWPRSLKFTTKDQPIVGAISLVRGGIDEASRLSQKKVRVHTGDLALADSSDDNDSQ